MIVQIYEVNNPTEAEELVRVGVNHIGVLVGKGKFPRELSFNDARRIFDVLPDGVKGVALTLEDNFKEIIEAAEKTSCDILHICTVPDNFSVEDAKRLKERFPGLKIMIAIPVVDDNSVKLAKSYEGVADFLLLDSYKKGGNQIGATGQTHDWSISKRIVETVKIPAILAGGLSPDNVAEAIRTVRPAGVDSKTKTDKETGTGKDIEKVAAFVNAAKSAV